MLIAVAVVLPTHRSAYAFSEVPGEPGVCLCDSCEDCTAAFDTVEDGNPAVESSLLFVPLVCDQGIRLSQDISDYSGSCISTDYNDSGITFDCQGNTIDGDTTCDTYAISINYSSGLSIQNCTIQEFDVGIGVADSDGIIVRDNTLLSNVYRGIDSSFNINSVLENNTITNMLPCEGTCNGSQILSDASFMRLRGLSAWYDEGIGIYEEWSSGNTLTNNRVYNNCTTGIYENCVADIDMHSNASCNNGDYDITVYDSDSCSQQLVTNILGESTISAVRLSSTGSDNACIYSSGWADAGVESGCTNNPACYSMSLSKTVSASPVAKGSPVTYTYLLTNTGYLPIGEIQLSDDTCMPTEFPGVSLDAGESMQTTCTMTLNSTTTNVATADGFAFDVQDGAYGLEASATATVQTYTTLDPDYIGNDHYDPETSTYHVNVGVPVVVDGITDTCATVVVELINGTTQTCTTSPNASGYFSCRFPAYSHGGTYNIRITAACDDQAPSVLGAYTLLVGLSDTGTGFYPYFIAGIAGMVGLYIQKRKDFALCKKVLSAK